MHKIYASYEFSKLSPGQIERLVALLSELGFDGFEEKEETLVAFAEKGKYDINSLDKVLAEQGLDPVLSWIPEENWNAAWESSFEPVVIPGRVAIRAEFHHPVPGVELDIVITPKMSFGTGHHSTTLLMMEALYRFSPAGRKVLDFGTGTGILAILAEKKGAMAVLAIDNDPWSISNARENIARNQCRHILLEEASTLPDAGQFDILLANINKSVILSHKAGFAARLAEGGILIISGLLIEDRQEILQAFEPLFGMPIHQGTKNNWISLAFMH